MQPDDAAPPEAEPVGIPASDPVMPPTPLVAVRAPNTPAPSPAAPPATVPVDPAVPGTDPALGLAHLGLVEAQYLPDAAGARLLLVAPDRASALHAASVMLASDDARAWRFVSCGPHDAGALAILRGTPTHSAHEVSHG